MWFDANNWKLIAAMVITAVGFLAVVVFNVAYFAFVLPYMKRRHGGTAIVKALTGLMHGQLFEYCRTAPESRTSKHRKVAFAIKASLLVFFICFISLGIIALMQL